jgi:hypothetical protein
LRVRPLAGFVGQDVVRLDAAMNELEYASLLEPRLAEEKAPLAHGEFALQRSISGSPPEGTLSGQAIWFRARRMAFGYRDVYAELLLQRPVGRRNNLIALTVCVGVIGIGLCRDWRRERAPRPVSTEQCYLDLKLFERRPTIRATVDVGRHRGRDGLSHGQRQQLSLIRTG